VVGGAEWPDEPWKVAALRDGTWRPLPFQQFIVKLHGWCNLSCDYCYVYEMADQSWRNRPRGMPARTVEQTAHRIGEHVAAHGLSDVNVVFHGGEPLLVGKDALARAATAMRHAVPAGADLTFRLQTNGVLLTRQVLDTLLEHHIMVGVSLDGGPEAHDRHRRQANGRGSHAAVVRGLRRLRQDPYRELFSHLYCTVDVANDPVATYEALLEFEPPLVDFLLPHGTWTVPPPRRTAGTTSTPYADWLIAIFDRWYGAPHQETRVRYFESIISMVLGGHSGVETIGLEPCVLLVIDTDGTLQQVDSLKSSFHGAPETGLNVFEHSFDAALEHPAIAARQVGAEALCATCRSCPVGQVCGAGYYPHRHRPGTGFLNPSVYCPDLFKLIHHIRHRVLTDLDRLLERA
jgi:uncharacterized protein